MLVYGRSFKLSQLVKAVSVVGSATSPLLIKALRKGPLTAFEFSSRAFELCSQLTASDVIPAITLSRLTSSMSGSRAIWIDLSEPSAAMPPGELACLCSLVKLWNPQVVVEIGTFKGFTTRHLSHNTANSCQIFTVDLPPQLAQRNAAFFSDSHLVKAASTIERDFGNDRKITQILQDSTTIEWEKFLSRPIDFALIDGSHLYQHVRKDTEGIIKALAPNGLVVWHDYLTVEIRRGVRKYLVELYNQGMPVRRLAGTSFCVYTRGLKDDSLPTKQTLGSGEDQHPRKAESGSC